MEHVALAHRRARYAAACQRPTPALNSRHGRTCEIWRSIISTAVHSTSHLGQENNLSLILISYYRYICILYLYSNSREILVLCKFQIFCRKEKEKKKNIIIMILKLVFCFGKKKKLLNVYRHIDTFVSAYLHSRIG